MSATAFQRMRRERIAKMRAEAEQKEAPKALIDFTNKELVAMLDEKGIEYPKKFNKTMLIALLEQSDGNDAEDEQDKETEEDEGNKDPEDDESQGEDPDDEGAE